MEKWFSVGSFWRSPSWRFCRVALLPRPEQGMTLGWPLLHRWFICLRRPLLVVCFGRSGFIACRLGPHLNCLPGDISATKVKVLLTLIILMPCLPLSLLSCQWCPQLYTPARRFSCKDPTPFLDRPGLSSLLPKLPPQGADGHMSCDGIDPAYDSPLPS
jgi:hypothetical protein